MSSSRWLLALGAGTIALALAIPFAPVRSDQVDVSWPKEGQPASSTVAMFMPYRPLQLDVSLACSAVSASVGSGAVTAFATFPPDADGARKWGMSLVTRDQQLFLAVADREHALGKAPSADCSYRLHAEGRQLVVSVADGSQLRELTRIDTLVPQVVAFVTDLPPAQAADTVSAHAQADARFQTSPTPLKSILMIGCALGVLACLVAGFCFFGKRDRPREVDASRRRAADLVWTGLAAAGIVAWGILGPQSVDDGWFLGMHRNFGAAGYAGDYYMSLNAAETPAVGLQYLFAPLFHFSWSPLWLRIPVMLAGLAMWGLALGVVRLVRRYTDRPRVPHWLFAAAFFVAWMPGGAGLRPEPFVALCVAVSGYAAVRAHLTQAPAWLLVGAVAAGLSFTVTSTGFLAVVPLAIGLVYTCRRLTALPDRVILLVLTLAAMTVAVPIAFQATGLGGFLDSAGARYWYGADLSWHHEFNRYQMLLGGGISDEFQFEQHPMRRLPVLLAIGLTVIVLALRVRHRDGSTFSGPFGWPFAWYGLGLATLVFTPTKIGSHFFALAFFTVLVLAFGLSGLPRAFAREHVGWVFRLSALFLVLLLTSVAFNGINSWWAYHRLGMPQLNKKLLHGVLANPVLILVAGAVTAAAIMLVVRRWGRGSHDVAPAPVRWIGWTVVAIAGLSVLVMPPLTAGLLTKAAVNQHNRGAWSTVASNLHSVTGSTCGASDAITVDGTDRTLSQVIAGQPGPTLVDWPISFWFPCARFPQLADGLLEAPATVVVAPGPYRFDGDLTRAAKPHGGAFAPMTKVAAYRELPSRLVNDPELTGLLLAVDYRYPVGAYDVRKTVADQPGWHRDPPYASQDYVGQAPPGG
ncbi:arabinosyltransferase domain-containing protein [Amycolatopsis echigonensis]|uniref:Arabinosyltransferase domain-containing protein n=1 Tax=Amycolatopsis echigonensis TaxID=2576905 RepID=A0A2N3WFX0_9PSEU|nr:MULTISPECIES: arabinosyltransferase domain-containing protein [Amycolatopsis]MBB2497860.1 arabinosyltransferase domain-containing protein [Amycolatopsis echigonensis]PKV92778.1 cell wall arabinan synthesis protein [Amycolatopsis niigatensis]